MAEGSPTSWFSPDTLESVRAAGDVAALRAVEAAEGGRVEEAKGLFEVAVAGSGDIRVVYAAFQFRFRLGEYDAAERLVKRRLELAAPGSADEARAWNNYGLIWFFRGELDRAEECLKRALEMDRALGNEEGVARDLGNLSLVPEARGELDEAERLNLEALAVAERVGYRAVVASRLCNLGEIALARGEKRKARELIGRAEAAFGELGDEKNRAKCEALRRGMDDG